MDPLLISLKSLIYIFLIWLGVQTNLFGHDSRFAFFKITSEQNTTQVEAEFPWLLRNALLKFEPGLKYAKQKNEFLEAFEKYINFHLILKDENHNRMPLISISEIKDESKHPGVYLLVFNGINPSWIYNQLLIDVAPNHKNLHTLIKDHSSYFFTTNQSNKNHSIETSKIQNSSAIPYLALVSLFILGFVFINYTKKTN
ncbi:MAG: hypothetical protein VW080_02990 [Flavobacteriaceae bacterium]